MAELDFYLILSMIAFIAGYVDGVAGGGAMIMIPALLTAGLPPHLALGTNKLAATLGIFNAARTYLKHNLLKPRYWLAAMIAVFIGALIGAVAAHLLSSAFLAKVLPLFLILVAIYMLLPQSIKQKKRDPHFKPNRVSSVTTGSILGFYDGFFGPGTGGFWVTAMMAIYKMDILQASAIAKLMNFISNFTALLTFIILNHVDYFLGLTMGVTLMIGSYLGVRSAIAFGGKFIRPLFLAVVLIMATQLVWTQWFH